MRALRRFAFFSSLVLLPSGSRAEIRFQDVTAHAGIDDSGPTFGAAVGDLNGDGLPDLWVGTHGRVPRLYLNRGDGTFRDVAPQVWPGPVRDNHAAAWADFDGDGDGDLMECVGASGPHQLWVNEGGLLVDRARERGVAFPGARGRQPLWFDVDADGRLDLALAHDQASDPALGARLLLQDGGAFVDVTAEAGFLATGALYLQAADLDDDRRGELVVSGATFPAAVYPLPWRPGSLLQNVRSSLGFPNQGGSFAMDSVLADLDGDLRTDVFVVKQSRNVQVLPVDGRSVRARINAFPQNERGLSFVSGGPIGVDVHLTGSLFTSPEELIRIGAGSVRGSSFELSLDPADPAVWGTPPHDVATQGLWIGFDPPTQTWTITLSSPASAAVNMIVEGSLPLTSVAAIGFANDTPDPWPNLYVASAGGFVERRVEAGLGRPLGCFNAVAGDFDNDMDLDLYLACNQPIANAPNQLFENVGGGRFVGVADAGGAPGPDVLVGRSDVVTVVDYDLDGALDLFLTNGEGDPPTNDGPLQLYRNLGGPNHWLEIDLRESRFNPTGRGAEVRVLAGGVTQVRYQGGGMHRRAQDMERLHFGLGPHRQVDAIEVRWADGVISRVGPAPADRILVIEKPPIDCGPSAPDSDGDGVADPCDNCRDVANPGQEDLDAGGDDDSSLAGVQHYGDACDVDLDNDGTVGASDFFAVVRPCLGRSVSLAPQCARADLDGDGMVGASDFFAVLRPALGRSPGPGVTEP